MFGGEFPDIPPQPERSKWAFWGAWVFGILILAVLILIVLKIGDLRNFAQLAVQSRPEWLAAAILFQFLTYVCVASAWRATLLKTGHPVPLPRLVPLGLAKLFTDQAIPSVGMSGNLLVLKGLLRRGIPVHLVLTALFVDIIGYYIAYMIMALGTLFLLRAYYQAHAALLSTFTLFAALAIGIPSLIIWLKRRTSRSIPGIIHRLPFSNLLFRIIREVPSEILRNPVLIFKNTFFEAGIFILDALTLWAVLLSIGQKVPFMIPFTVFIAASVVGTVSPVPTGLGTFEAVAVATLGLLQVPIEAALTATLLLRGFTFWLPMIPGLIMAQKEIRGKTVVDT
jgi:uncharacterized protein (TIRG00374 family)